MEKFLALLNAGDPIVTLLVVVAVCCIAGFALLAVINSKAAKQYEADKRQDAREAYYQARIERSCKQFNNK